MPPIRSVEELRKAIGLGTVHILNVAKDGVAYVGFEFGCEWAEAHGMGVLMHHDRVLEVSQGDISFNEALAIKDGGEHIQQRKR